MQCCLVYSQDVGARLVLWLGNEATDTKEEIKKPKPEVPAWAFIMVCDGELESPTSTVSR